MALATGLLGGALGLEGCGVQPGSFDVPDSNQTKMTNLMALVEFKKPPRPPDPTDPVVCPDIVILDGTADDRVYASGDQSNANLRYQFSITDIARDCRVEGGQLTLRVGVAGKVLLGPMGSSGTFTGPVRVAVTKEGSDQSVVTSKLYQVNVGVPAGQSEGTFSLVTESFAVPYPHKKAQHDYTIKVGFDTGGKEKHNALPEAAEKMPTAPAAATGERRAQPRMHGAGAPTY